MTDRLISRVSSFPPGARPDAPICILGSMPGGDLSMRECFSGKKQEKRRRIKWALEEIASEGYYHDQEFFHTMRES